MTTLTDVFDQAQIPYHTSGLWGIVAGEMVDYVELPGRYARTAWLYLREHLPQSHPLVIPPHTYPRGLTIGAQDAQIQTALRDYGQLSLNSWWPDRWGNYDFDREYDELADFQHLAVDLREPLPNPQPSHEFRVTLDHVTPDPTLAQDYAHAVWLLTFPHLKGWELPIYLQFGGWNACPDPQEHGAVLAYWYHYYGAELFGLGSDVLELWVADPPVSLTTAMVLAKEQMAYCDDLVFQGTLTVKRLAQYLLGSTSWSFWWD